MHLGHVLKIPELAALIAKHGMHTNFILIHILQKKVTFIIQHASVTEVFTGVFNLWRHTT